MTLGLLCEERITSFTQAIPWASLAREAGARLWFAGGDDRALDPVCVAAGLCGLGFRIPFGFLFDDPVSEHRLRVLTTLTAMSRTKVSVATRAPLATRPTVGSSVEFGHWQHGSAKEEGEVPAFVVHSAAARPPKRAADLDTVRDVLVSDFALEWPKRDTYELRESARRIVVARNGTDVGVEATCLLIASSKEAVVDYCLAWALDDHDEVLLRPHSQGMNAETEALFDVAQVVAEALCRREAVAA